MTEQRRHHGNGTWLPLIRHRGAVLTGRWLLHLRWLAVAGILLGTGLARALVPGRLPEAALLLVGIAVLGTNLLLLRWARRIDQSTTAAETARAWLGRAQVGLDWLALMVLLHLSGGLESPLLLLFVFHVASATLILRRHEALAFTLAAIGLLAGLGVSEASGALPHLHVAGFLPGEASSELLFVTGMLTALTVVGLAAFFLTSAVASGVRHSEG